MKQARKILFLIPLLFFACKKDQNEKIYSINKQHGLLANRFAHLKIEKVAPVTFNYAKGSLKEALNSRKLSTLTYLRDSTWENIFGRSAFYESDEMVVTPSNRSYVYPGSILKASSIATDEFQTFFGFERAPITAQLSFPSSLSYGTIENPTLSNSRIFLRNAIMSPDFSGKQIDDFTQNISYFSRYEEVKLAYGYNVNERRLFSSTNASFDYNSTGKRYSTKLVASYMVKNFTYSMSDPVDGQLIDMSTITPEIFEGISPVYINSVTYGRLGILVVETDNNSSQMKSAFEKVVKKIFKQTNESFTQEQTVLFNSCRVTIYILGSAMGESTIQLLINPSPESVSSFLSENVGVFTSQDPGVPISFTAKYLKDNSRFKTVFRLDFPN